MRPSFTYGGFISSNTPTLMENGDIQQKSRDRKSNACFKCHKGDCGPYKCGKVSARLKIVNTSAEKGT